MPLYEYKCRKCSRKFEKLRGMFDNDEDVKCPECGGKAPERVFSVFGAVTTGGAGCSTSQSGVST